MQEIMNKQKFIKLFSKRLTGEIDAQELELLDKTMAENKPFRELANQLENYRTERNMPDDSHLQSQLSQIWNTIDAHQPAKFEGKYQFTPYKPKSYPKIWTAAAAIFIVISGACLGYYHFLGKQSVLEFNRLTTSDGKTFKLLDDGTRVWLNKYSTLTYNKAFGKYARDITIDGEAYFDVVKNKKIPLIVHAGNIDIEVKGTAFNVKKERNSQDIEVALVRGLIQVRDRQNENNVLLLHPNQKVVYNAAQQDQKNRFGLKVLNASLLLNETSWTADTLVFRKEKLKDLAIKMQKK
ncbi:MAG: hypothetical protein EOO20_16835, partial [Chryseobacterium sp.]